ncbi:MAG: response regulator [Acidobacteriota bacterium]|nr:response regulator [Acidobacteriota bacterium]
MREARRPTVMVAYNYEDTRALLKFWLEGEGYRVVEAADGQEAVELTRGKCPDLILMPERMPMLGGVEASRRIREQGKDCTFPIVCTSTYPTQEARASALAGGCDSFIAEPLDLSNLGSLLSRLLPESASHQLRASS